SADSGFPSGSLTNATCSFWDAHETNMPAAASNKTAATFLSCLRICASIDDNVPRLHLDASRQCAGDDIGDSGRRFNRRNANFPNKGAVSQHQHLGMRLDAVAPAELQDDKIIS